MRIHKIAVAILYFAATAAAQYRDHPRLLMTEAEFSEMSSIASNPAHADHAKWTAVKTQADLYATYPIFAFTIADISRANPAVVTVNESLPSFTTTSIYLSGGTGDWAQANTPNCLTCVNWTAQRLSATTFAVYKNSALTTTVDTSEYSTTYAGSSQAMGMHFRILAPSGRIVYPYQGEGWLSQIFPLLVAYKATGSATYANKILEWMDLQIHYYQTGNVGPVQADAQFSFRSMGFLYGLAHDWMYSYAGYDATRKTNFTAAMKFIFNYAGARINTEPCHSNYPSGFLLGMWTMGFALAGEDAAAQDMIDLGASWYTSNNVETCVFAFATSPEAGEGYFADGFWVEGSQYSPNTMLRLLMALRIARNAKTTPADEVSPGLADVANAYARGQFYQTKPNMLTVIPEGDNTGCTGSILYGKADNYSFLSLVLAGSEIGAHIEHWRRNLYTSQATCGLAAAKAEDFLWTRAARTATDYTGSKQKYFYQRGVGYSYRRGTWANTALWSGYNGAFNKRSSHRGRTGGHLEITRGMHDLITHHGFIRGTSVAEFPGLNGTPANGIQSSQFGNGPYYYDGGAYLLTNDYYRGGNRGPSNFIPPKHRETSLFSYSSQNFSYLAYDKPAGQENRTNKTSRLIHRQYVAFDQGETEGVFIVYDKILKKNVSDVYQQRFHLNKSATSSVAGLLGTTSYSTSRAYVRTVLPSNAVMEKCLTSTSEGPATACDATSGNALAERFEITDPDGTDDQQFLTVIFATSTSGSEPASNAIATIDGNHIGVEIAAASPVVFVAAKGWTLNTSVYPWWTLNEYNAATFTTTISGTQNIIVANLTPGTYDVERDSSPHSTPSVTVGNDGTAYFTGPAGAYSLSIDTGAAPTIETTNLPDGFVSQSYNATISCVGGQSPRTLTITTGSLPMGLSLDADTGIISGTAPASAGTTNFTATCTGADMQTDTQPLSITLLEPGAPLAVFAPEATCAQNNDCDQPLFSAAGGARPYTWAFNGTLPSGMSYPSSSDVTQLGPTGTPAEVGDFPIEACVTDDETTEVCFERTLTITPPASDVTVTTTPSDSCVIATLRKGGMDSATTYSLSIRDENTNLVVSGPISVKGAQVRSAVLCGLSPSANYRAEVSAQNSGGSDQFVTLAAPDGAVDRLFAAGRIAGATHIKVEFGQTDALGSEAIGECSGDQCAALLEGITPGVYFMRHSFCANSGCESALNGPGKIYARRIQ